MCGSCCAPGRPTRASRPRRSSPRSPPASRRRSSPPATTADGRCGATPRPRTSRRRLAAGEPYVVRFRAPEPTGDGRGVSFVDAIRGKLSHEANRNDAVILKSSDQSPRLPTYHFAHAVDDHLMRVTLVIRSEEWISSVPLHQQLFTALGHPPITYAHIAPLMKQIPGGKRKLSKRKDPEASVDYYIAAGYPAAAVLYYLRGLANGRLAELPLAEALAAPIRLDQCGVGGPAGRPGQAGGHQRRPHRDVAGAEVLAAVTAWARPTTPNWRRAGHRAGAGAARDRRRAGRGGQPAQGPAQVVGFPQPPTASSSRRCSTRLAGPGDVRVRKASAVDPAAVTAFVGDLVGAYRHLDDPQASGSTRSAPRARATGSPRARRSTRPTPTPSTARSARPPSSCGWRSPAPPAARTCTPSPGAGARRGAGQAGGPRGPVTATARSSPGRS